MYLTDRWFPLRYHPVQTALLQSKKRYKAVVAGRGSGKTELARRYLTMKLFEAKPWPDPKYFYVLPTAEQGGRVAWTEFLMLIPPHLIKRKNQNKMFLETITGSQLHVCSGEKPQRLEGVQWDGGIFDESSDMKEKIFDLNLGPAMTHRTGWCWRIGVPKRRGVGAKEFRQFFDRGIKGDPSIDSFTWMSKDILSKDEIDEKKRSLAPQDYQEQYEASWEQTTGLAFQDFSEENISDTCIYHPSMPILVGSDFNVDPMAWVLGHMINGELQIFGEIWLRGTNTRKTLDHLFSRFSRHRAGFYFIGDASSAARKTSASDSDYLQIANDSRFEPKELYYPRSNPAIADRLSATNAAILNASGLRRLKVHSSCVHLITDLENRYFKEGTSILADKGDLGHITDALGYLIWQLIPLELENQSSPSVLFNV